MAIQYLSVDPGWGLYIFLYYVCVLCIGIWGYYFTGNTEAPKKTCNNSYTPKYILYWKDTP